jgi:hypothetical protein
MTGAPPRRSSAVLLATALGGVLTVGVAVVALRTCRPDGSVPVVREGGIWRPAGGAFAGDESCRGCHAAEFEAHGASAHARTLRRIDRKERPGSPGGQPVTDPLTGASYQMTESGGRPVLRLTAGGTTVDAPVRWEFGSGAHARGYLVESAGQLVDCRINWYRSLAGWDFASGQDKPTRSLLEQPLGRPLDAAETARCFSCHTSQLFARGATDAGVSGGTLQLRLDRTVAGVGCESCHGPRAEHARAARRGPLPRTAPLTAAEMNRMCARCHSDSGVTANHEVAVRFQPWGLERSACYLRSDGKLSCKSCHDPHTDAVQDDGHYERKCLSCHSRGAAGPAVTPAALCKIRPDSGCVPCHMRRDDKAMLHMTFTDHQIRIWPDSAPRARPQ